MTGSHPTRPGPAVGFAGTDMNPDMGTPACPPESAEAGCAAAAGPWHGRRAWLLQALSGLLAATAQAQEQPPSRTAVIVSAAASAAAPGRAPGSAVQTPAAPGTRPAKAGPDTPAGSHAPFGRVDPPQAPPALNMTGDDGRRFKLPQRLRGATTGVQLMFTGCSAICPIQGALFADVAGRLQGSGIRLLSLSVDPLGDDARALRGWLDRFGADERWRAAVPAPDELDAMLDFLRGRASGVDRHTGQVYLFDRQGRLVWRTPELPPPAYVAEMLRTVDALR